MRYLLFLFLLCLCSCSNLYLPFSKFPALIEVYKDEYILEAKGEWCPYPNPTKTYCEGLPKGIYSIDESGKAALISTSLSSERKIVAYQEENDYCKLEGKADCSPNYVARSYSDPLLKNLWGFKNAKILDAWENCNKEAKVSIGVLDTGVDCNHPDIKCHKQFDAINNKETQFDEDGHGTHVAGTICATHNNEGVAGVVKNCELYAIKFMGKGSGSYYAAIKGIDWAIKNKVKVLNNSWGGRGYSRPLENAIKRARASGMLFVAAAGNDGVSNDKIPHYPSNYALDNVISVASIDKTDKLSYFSNYGDSVDIAAPGSNILSTWPNKKYKSLNGTSMASPHVSGVATLLWERDYLTTKQKLFEYSLKGNVKVQGSRKLRAIKP